MPLRFMGGLTRAQVLNAVIPQLQNTTQLTQPAPTQNVWYTVLATTPFTRVINILFAVRTTGENLEVEVTIDGVVFTVVIAAAANTYYYCYFVGATVLPSTALVMNAGVTSMLDHRPFFFDANSIQVRIRKTSNNGAGDLCCGVAHQLF